MMAAGLSGSGLWLLIAACPLAAHPAAAVAAAAGSVAQTAAAVEVAQGSGTREGELQPRYQPVAEEPCWYDSSYIFAATRGVADSTLVPALKVPLFLLTVPLDLALLPFATIGGFF